VRLTNRLTNSPACLVADENGMDASLERLLKSAGQQVGDTKQVFEINSEHPLIQTIEKIEDETKFDDWTSILFDQALLSEGGKLEDPATFVTRLNKMFVNLS
jgi:molecular chaperone HtpG